LSFITVAFYNFETLTINDPDTFDEEWTPTGFAAVDRADKYEKN
jgi:hypothetical protein